MKPLVLLGASRDDLLAMPRVVRHGIGVERWRVQFGALPSDFKPMPAVGPGAQPNDRSQVVSRKNDPRRSDARRIKGSGDVFLDLGFDPAEAKVMALRAEVMLRLEQHLQMKGWTQSEAARRLGISQPRVSRLIRGKWQDFSLDMLLTLAARAGLEPELRLAA